MADRWAQEFNGGDDEDEAMRLALAMSLGKEAQGREVATPGKKRTVTVDLTKDEIDLTQDDVETASEASSPGPGLHVAQTAGSAEDGKPGEAKTGPAAQRAQKVAQERSPRVDQKQPVPEPEPAPAPAPASSLSLFGLDRAKMEEERLARLRKRKAAGDGGGGESDSKRVRANDENRPPGTTGRQNVPQKGAQQLRVPPASRAENDAKPTARATGQQQNMTPKNELGKLRFPKGVVKKTWVKGQPRLGDDIRLEEVLQKDELELAVISSFQWDQDWMLDKFDLRKTRLVLVSTGGDEAEVRADCNLFPAYGPYCACYDTCCRSPAIHPLMPLCHFLDSELERVILTSYRTRP